MSHTSVTNYQEAVDTSLEIRLISFIYILVYYGTIQLTFLSKRILRKISGI